MSDTPVVIPEDIETAVKMAALTGFPTEYNNLFHIMGQRFGPILKWGHFKSQEVSFRKEGVFFSGRVDAWEKDSEYWSIVIPYDEVLALYAVDEKNPNFNVHPIRARLQNDYNNHKGRNVSSLKLQTLSGYAGRLWKWFNRQVVPVIMVFFLIIIMSFGLWKIIEMGFETHDNLSACKSPEVERALALINNDPNKMSTTWNTVYYNDRIIFEPNEDGNLALSSTQKMLSPACETMVNDLVKSVSK